MKRTIGNKFVSKIVSRVKKEEYWLDENITGIDILSLIRNKFFMVIRGFLVSSTLKSHRGITFVGRGTKFLYPRKINIGSGCNFGRNCLINGLSKDGIFIGNNFTLGDNSIIECSGVIRELGESLVIGNNVGISSNAFLGVRGKVQIGDNTIIGPYFSLHAENHEFNNLNELIKNQPTNRKGITIGENCWIGAKVTILDGVKIGNGCVIAAGSVVTKDISDNSLIAGVPAKYKKMRGN